MSKQNILFICTGNSARSQMAEGLMRARGAELFDVYSVGSRPALEVHPLAIAVLDEIGIDIRSQRPKGFGDLPQNIVFDYVISVCDMDLGGCPFAPGRRKNCHWELLDPAPLAEVLGDPAKGRRLFRTTRDVINQIVEEILDGLTVPSPVGPEVSPVWTNRHFAAILRDFQHLSRLQDPVKAGVKMFSVLEAARKHARDSDAYRRVFVAHGHDKGVREDIKDYLTKTLGMVPVVLQEIMSAGHTIIEKLEAHSDVIAAVIIITEDDLAMLKAEKEKPKRRARENVIFEMGYFVAKLGRPNVCIVRKGHVQLPSDLAGLEVIRFDIESGWKTHIASFMQRAVKNAKAAIVEG
jgi:predicted nucleotide-binding protein/protein-tyrosine-phosphatase